MNNETKAPISISLKLISIRNTIEKYELKVATNILSKLNFNRSCFSFLKINKRKAIKTIPEMLAIQQLLIKNIADENPRINCESSKYNLKNANTLQMLTRIRANTMFRYNLFFMTL